MILRTIPLIALPFGVARLKAMLAFGRQAFNGGGGRRSGRARRSWALLWTWICRSSRPPRNNRPIPNPAACRRCWSMRRPGRTPPPCTPEPRRGRIRVVAGSTDPPCSAVSIHEVGKTCRRRAVPYLGDFGPFLPFFGSPEAQLPASAIGCGNKIVMIQWLFKFSLS
jgi:hypothetical protein